MRIYGMLLLLGIMLLALPFSQADLGTAPAWSPDWGPPPVAYPLDMSAINTKALGDGVPGNAAQVSYPYVGPVPLTGDHQCPVPLVGTPADYATARAMALQVPRPAIPSIPLVESPHDRSVRAIEVPNGATVLLDGTIVTGGTGMGSSGTGNIFTPPDPPALLSYRDNIGTASTGIPSFNAPILFSS